MAADDTTFPLAKEFAMIVFTIKVSSADIESYFSRTKYIKNLYRSRLSDKLTSATLTVAKTKKVKDVEVLTVYNGTYDVRAAWSTCEFGQDALTKKYVGAKVCKEFVDDDDGSVREYTGEITGVHFVQSESQYMMHVSYLSDSDSEDMEEWEVKENWVGFEDT